jgi:hypothetical protein
MLTTDLHAVKEQITILEQTGDNQTAKLLKDLRIEMTLLRGVNTTTKQFLQVIESNENEWPKELREQVGGVLNDISIMESDQEAAHMEYSQSHSQSN